LLCICLAAAASSSSSSSPDGFVWFGSGGLFPSPCDVLAWKMILGFMAVGKLTVMKESRHSR
jgi:hypothetical protein